MEEYTEQNTLVRKSYAVIGQSLLQDDRTWHIVPHRVGASMMGRLEVKLLLEAPAAALNRDQKGRGFLFELELPRKGQRSE